VFVAEVAEGRWSIGLAVEVRFALDGVDDVGGGVAGWSRCLGEDLAGDELRPVVVAPQGGPDSSEVESVALAVGLYCG
jgi:hypothetical protein